MQTKEVRLQVKHIRLAQSPRRRMQHIKTNVLQMNSLHILFAVTKLWQLVNKWTAIWKTVYKCKVVCAKSCSCFHPLKLVRWGVPQRYGLCYLYTLQVPFNELFGAFLCRCPFLDILFWICGSPVSQVLLFPVSDKSAVNDKSANEMSYQFLDLFWDSVCHLFTGRAKNRRLCHVRVTKSDSLINKHSHKLRALELHIT